MDDHDLVNFDDLDEFEGCPEEQEFENLQKQSKMTKTRYCV